MKKVNIEDIVPYMDETPLTDKVLEDMGFEKMIIPIEEIEGDEDFYYYELDLFPNDVNGDLALISTDNNKDKTIQLFPYNKPVFKTKGSVEMLLILLKGDENY